ncbi:MAG: sugar ABC transporter ATP-binding protein [Acidobacteriota bacterium]
MKADSTHSTPVLQMRGMTKTFRGVVALEQVDFEVRAGEVHVLLGENGAGKSTLMKILSGAYRKDGGEILLDGTPVDIQSPGHAQQLGIGIIYQEFNLIPHLSVAENIYLANEPEIVPGVIDRKRQVANARALLGGMGLRLDPLSEVGSLSVAEQQIVEVAKALSLNARILIMDEPTSALTRQEIQNLFSSIGKLKEQGVAVIYISHRLEELRQIGDRVTVLRDGKYIATHRVSEITTEHLIRLIANRRLKEHFPKRQVPLGEELLRLADLTRGQLFRRINLSLKRGEVLGLAGLMGSGRTALARSIFGVDPFDSGQLFVGGQPVRIHSPSQAIRHGIGFLSEDRKSEGLCLDLSVARNISLPNSDRVSRAGVIDRGKEEALARRFIAELRIKTPSPEQKVALLSGGNQQKIVLSKWLAGEADILIFDEPTRGIDVAAKVEIYELMNRLTARGAGILMISSEMPEILGMSDRILVMHEGRITAELARKEATQEKVLRAALGQVRKKEGNEA